MSIYGLKKVERTQAEWIWCEDNTIPNDWVLFRHEFESKNCPDSARLHIAAETRYFLYLNGKTVVLDGGLFRADKAHGYRDSMEIAPYIQTGRNVLEILVWYYGNGGRNNVTFPYGGLLYDCEKLGIFSGAHTSCVRHASFFETGEPLPSYLFGGYNIGYNANMPMPTMHPATVFPRENYGELYERPIPMLVSSNVIVSKYTKIGEHYTVDLPAMRQVLPYMKVVAMGGEVIQLSYDRYETSGGPGDHNSRYRGHRTEYVCMAGENRFLGFDWFATEQLYFTIPSSVQVQELGYVVSEYDTQITDILHTNDKFLDKLMQKCARTLKVCLRDNFMDCPDRERGQWIGDVSVQAPQVFYALTNSAIPLLKKAIVDFIGLRKGDILVGNVPGENFTELPSQSLNAISELGMVANYYHFTGDRAVLEMTFEPAVRYLQLWNMGDDGMVIRRDGNWYWQDHLYNVDSKILENCWYYSALCFAKRMANLIGDSRFDDFIATRIASIQSNFENLFWQGRYYSSGQFVDERANAMAVLTGLALPEHKQLLKDVFVMVFNCSTYMEGYVCEALCKLGYLDLAYNRMCSRYYNLVVNENSTLWEDFYILGTRNHAWTGAPLTIVYRYILGLIPSESAECLCLNPNFSLLSELCVSVEFDGKPLHIVGKFANGCVELTIDNPTNRLILLQSITVGVRQELHESICPHSSFHKSWQVNEM